MAKRKATEAGPSFGFRNIELTNGTFRYEIAVDGMLVLQSSRTFLAEQECNIEREWLTHKLGWCSLR